MRSMTAYASFTKNKSSHTVQVTLRSLNYKYLDICTHSFSPEDILLEEVVKREIKKKIYRGKVEVFIFSAQPQGKEIYIDKKAVNSYVSQIKILAKKYKVKDDINMSDILNLPQVVSWQKNSKTDQPFVLSAVRQALDRLIRFKEKEGQAIKKEILRNLRDMQRNLSEIKDKTSKISRMENEKEDIAEEVALCAFYINKLKKKINDKKVEPKGRAMDFLTQEILRELNAASSKTKKRIPALLIVEAKNYLERIREQAQNIE